jgi:tetratricopeptide (TPR) repeat protein
VKHPTSRTPALWLWLLGLVVIGLVVGAPLYLRHGRSDRDSDTTGISPDGAGVFGPSAVGAVRAAVKPVGKPELRQAVEPFGKSAPSQAADVPDPVGTLDPAELFDHGVALQARRDIAGAEAAYRRADEQGHPAAASNLGVLLEERGELTAAEAAYRRADERGESNGAFNLGVLLEERRDFAGAEAAYRRAERAADSRVARLARAALLDLIPGIADA